MTELEFFPYHNRHIVFKLNDGLEQSGVFFHQTDTYQRGIPRTMYIFIPTANLRAWKIAEQKNDKETMLSLQTEIDIKNITWAMRLNY